MKRPGRTAAFRGPDGRTLPGSVAEIRYLELGGVEQWVMSRGASVENPALIHLHGGPGLSESAFFRHFNSPLERGFTVISWDQRGANRSYDRNLPGASMTVERFVSDLDELVSAVCARLRQSRVVIFGHSWGSALGVLYAARHPERVAAYVGSGQIGDWAKAERLTYEFALAEAVRQGKPGAVRALRAIGPPPHSGELAMKHRLLLMQLDGQMKPRYLWKVARVLFSNGESSFLDLPRFWRGMEFSMDVMWPEVTRLNLVIQVPELRVPVFFFLGRHDHIVFPETSVEYFEALRAPSKELIWFENSGHEPFMDEPEKFNTAMLERVRPLAAR